MVSLVNLVAILQGSLRLTDDEGNARGPGEWPVQDQVGWWQMYRLTLISCAAIEFGAVPLRIHTNLGVVW